MGSRPPPLITFTLTSKVAVYTPAEWADTQTLFHLYQYMFSVVEPEANGDLWGTNERVLPWLVRWARRARTRDFYPALSALSGGYKNIFFLTAHFVSPFAQQPGQAVMPGHLSLNMRLCFPQTKSNPRWRADQREKILFDIFLVNPIKL